MIIKHLLIKLFRKTGYNLVKLSPEAKSFHSDELDFIKTNTGNYFLPRNAPRDTIAKTIRSGNIFDKEIYDVAKNYIQKGSVVLDVGSNFGQMAILFSDLVGETGNVYAFDADDFVFSILQKNIQANNKKNITSIFGAVHDKENEILYFPIQDFKKFDTYGSYGIDYVTNLGRPINSITIDGLNIEKEISFMKIDVQGGDLLALKGAKNTIQRHKMPIIFEYEYLFENDLNLCFQDYVDFVNEIGYKFSKVINGHNYLILPK
jgi:FkbM family methyltransferase